MDVDTKNIIDHVKYCNSVADNTELGEDLQPDLFVNSNIYNQAEASSIVHLNNTIVTCGLKLKVHINQNINQHIPLNQGIIVSNVEITPLCSINIQPGLPGEESQYLTDQMQSILSNNGPDLEKLVIKENKAVYVLYFDFIVLNHAGNLLDACVLAANAVMLSAKIPKVIWNAEKDNAEIVDGDDLIKMPLKKLIYSITYGLTKSTIMTNPEIDLEAYLKDNLEVVTLFINEDGKFMLPIIIGFLSPEKQQLIRGVIPLAAARMEKLSETVLKSCQ